MPRHSPYALLCLNYLFKSDLRSHLKLFSRLLELLCLRTFFTVTLALFISSDEILILLLPALLITEKPDFDFSWFFPYLVCHVLLFGFQWASKPSNFRLSGFTVPWSSSRSCKDRQPFGFAVMGSSGLEPPTSRLSGARSNLLSYEPVLKSLVVFLYRLPVLASLGSLASSLSGSRYLQSLKFCLSLSGPILPVRASGLEMMGFEPMTPCLQGRCSPNWATPPKVFRCLLRKLTQNWTTNFAFAS